MQTTEYQARLSILIMNTANSVMRNRRASKEHKNSNYAQMCWKHSLGYEDLCMTQVNHLMNSIEREWRQYHA